MFIRGREVIVLMFIDRKNTIALIPGGITIIEASVFSGTAFNVALISAEVEVDNNAFNYKTVEIVNGVFNSKSARALVAQQGRNVIIPDGVKFIEANSFSGNQFDSVTFSNKINISPDAFDPNIVQIKDGILSIDNAQSLSKSSIGHAIVPEGVQFIENNAFNNDRTPTKFTLPSSLISIGNGAFFNARSLTEIDIPEGVRSIGRNAFSLPGQDSSFSSFTQVNLPGSLNKIEMRAFAFNQKIEQVSFKTGLESIGMGEFRNTGTSDLKLPNGLKNIGDTAFYNSK